MTDWQAGIAAFTILFLLGETGLAGLADIIAWGVSVGYVTWAATKGGGLQFTQLTKGT